MVSLVMFSARAAMIAARSRGFIAGSGIPSFADTVISRASLPNSLDLTASCRPLRCMMFLNCECPDIALLRGLLGCSLGPRPELGSPAQAGRIRLRTLQWKWIEAGAL